MTRYRVRFPSTAAMRAALAAEMADDALRVVDQERAMISIEGAPAGPATRGPAASADARPRALDPDQLESLRARFGAEVVPDRQYALEREPDRLFVESTEAAEATMDDVLRLVGAPRVWSQGRGAGVTLAVVDTGVAGARAEIGAARRAGGWAVIGEDPWTDWKGHGTMCATIAAGSRADGGVVDGVAPEAGVLACRTSFYDSELTAIYDDLARRAGAGEVIVATNSFGEATGVPPGPSPDDTFPDALEKAIAAGVHVFFSAGNYHDDAGGAANACHPTTIWLHKCRADVMAVATCDLGKAMWDYSSRGPGQHAGQSGMGRKPDVTAPTPRNGEIVYGSALKVLPNGWGTSGACPQAAGLAALLLGLRPGLPRDELFDIIRGTAAALPHGWNCCGAGLLDCEAAVGRLASG